MKTILASIVIVITTLTSFAQADSGLQKKSVNDSITRLITEFKKKGLTHFTFKEIPIDGTLNEFTEQLRKQNFKILEVTNKDAIATGTFTGDEVSLLVQASPRSVYGVTVVYKEKDSWKSIKQQYDNIKIKLTEKYGEPIEEVEKFEDSLHEKYGMELYALKEDRCTFRSHFASKTGNGMIVLKISTNASISMNYIDSLNFLIANQEYNEY